VRPACTTNWPAPTSATSWRPAASFDLIVAADVLVYFGDLDALFAQVRAALRPAAGSAFAGAGFTLIEAERAVLRREHGADVGGWLVLLRA
jgi:predicted TPR repeat methyltransferase